MAKIDHEVLRDLVGARKMLMTEEVGFIPD